MHCWLHQTERKTHRTNAEGDAEAAGDEGTVNEGTLGAGALSAGTPEGSDSLAMLAAALVNLSAADRAKLAAMLLAGNDSKTADATNNASADKRRAKTKSTSNG